MYKICAKKKGFTLIELLVVISIIGVLSIFAVGGYIQYRKSAVLNLAEENIVSVVSQAKSWTVYGKGIWDEEDKQQAKSKCFGLKFEKGDEDDKYVLSMVEYDFDDQKRLVADRWIYTGCESAVADERFILLDRSVSITELSFVEEEGVDSNDIESFVFRFVPPEGILQVLQEGKSWEDEAENKVLQVKLNYLNSDVDYRELKIDLNTQNVQKND